VATGKADPKLMKKTFAPTSSTSKDVGHFVVGAPSLMANASLKKEELKQAGLFEPDNSKNNLDSKEPKELGDLDSPAPKEPK